jgi:hypothetical protein
LYIELKEEIYWLCCPDLEPITIIGREQNSDCPAQEAIYTFL